MLNGRVARWCIRDINKQRFIDSAKWCSKADQAAALPFIFLIMAAALLLQGCDKPAPVDPNKIHRFVFAEHPDKPEFLIPEKYQPHWGGDVISFRFDYKTKAPLASISKALDGNELSVRIYYEKNGNFFRYKSIVDDIKRKHRLDTPKTGVYKMGETEVIYLYAFDGDFLVVKDVAPGLRAFRAYRRLMDSVEVDYSITKEVSPDAFLEVDRSVMEMIDSFIKK